MAATAGSLVPVACATFDLAPGSGWKLVRFKRGAVVERIVHDAADAVRRGDPT